MMAQKQGLQFDNESDAYRQARNQLLVAERELRAQMESVAALRRELPTGHVVQEDYQFEEFNDRTKKYNTVLLSELFEHPRKSLVIYSFMFSKGGKPCPMCTAFLDSFNGVALHARTQLNIAVVAKGPIQEINAWRMRRGWSNLRMLSSASNTFNQDYFLESETESQRPLLTVFRKSKGAVSHFYSSEMFFTPNEKGQGPRHVDILFPLWNVFDYVPEGRPAKWLPKIEYQSK